MSAGPAVEGKRDRRSQTAATANLSQLPGRRPFRGRGHRKVWAWLFVAAAPDRAAPVVAPSACVSDVPRRTWSNAGHRDRCESDGLSIQLGDTILEL
jgi:hypothetical protein